MVKIFFTFSNAIGGVTAILGAKSIINVVQEGARGVWGNVYSNRCATLTKLTVK